MDVMAEVGACCVAEVMGTELYTLTPDTVVASARRLAFDNGIDHLLVLENGTLAGIVCKDDLRFAARNALVSECMSSPVLCIAPDTTLREAAQIMIEQNVSCLPVVTGTFLVGMVTRDALATAGLGGEGRDQVPAICAACGSREKVRRDPRASGIPLCAECLGRTSPNAFRRMADYSQSLISLRANARQPRRREAGSGDRALSAERGDRRRGRDRRRRLDGWLHAGAAGAWRAQRDGGRRRPRSASPVPSRRPARDVAGGRGLEAAVAGRRRGAVRLLHRRRQLRRRAQHAAVP